MTLEELLPDGDYRFSFRFERADPRAFFSPTECHDDLISQRRSWLRQDPKRYAALLPEGEPLLDETIELACKWGVLKTPAAPWSTRFPRALDRCVALGCELEPDFLLLRLEPSRTARLAGGVVCFPSAWSLEEKIGCPITAIHEVVPGLNAALGAQINSFLLKLRSEVAWSRSNWGLSRTAELNQHPSRGLPRLDEAVELEDVWLRVEHQLLLALPNSNGILFGIRIVNHSVTGLQNSPALTGLATALSTIPDSLAVYKGLAKAKQRLIELLNSWNSKRSMR